MTCAPIGYYVHHHGAGHLARATAIADEAAGRVVLMGTGIGSSGLDLPDDRILGHGFDGADELECRPDALHYAPVGHEGIRARVAAIMQWIATYRPALFVVDVSVEIAMLARLASVPIVYVRLNGERSDIPHLEAFRSAAGLLAPFHEKLEAASTQPWVRVKSLYVPGIAAKPVPRTKNKANVILVVIGRGGKPGDGETIAKAALSCPQWDWCVIGPCSPPLRAPSNLKIFGWVENAAQAIADATIVVGAAGDGLVSSVLAADRPFICLPEARPFDEQLATARGLATAGAAVVLSDWPAPDQWPALISQALALPDAARRILHNPKGASIAAHWLCELASASPKHLQEAA